MGLRSGFRNTKTGFAKFLAVTFAGCMLLFCLRAMCLTQNVDQESLPEDYQVFMSGFDAYQQKEYSTAMQKLNGLMAQLPNTPLRDVALF